MLLEIPSTSRLANCSILTCNLMSGARKSTLCAYMNLLKYSCVFVVDANTVFKTPGFCHCDASSMA